MQTKLHFQKTYSFKLVRRTQRSTEPSTMKNSIHFLSNRFHKIVDLRRLIVISLPSRGGATTYCGNTFMPPRHKDEMMDINQWFRFVSWCLCGNLFSVDPGYETKVYYSSVVKNRCFGHCIDFFITGLKVQLCNDDSTGFSRIFCR
jgi:hypothetical protein